MTDLLELERELAWFRAVLEMRLKVVFAAPTAALEGPLSLAELPPPPLASSTTPWAELVRDRAPEVAERLALVLALVSHLRPRLLDLLLARNPTIDRRYTEFGGHWREERFEPTGDTLAFLLAGDGLEGRLAAEAVLAADHPLQRHDLLRPPPGDLPALRAPLRLTPAALSRITTGRVPPPPLGAAFPAQPLATDLEWSDLVLHPATLRQLEEIQTFLDHGSTLLKEWGMAARLRPGCRALFHGPPGTGKTLSAALLGRRTGLEVQRVDLSLLVSKYIGDTEKNLARVFEQAERRRWILFFDEADALFGKRSDTKDAHDRYANQEVAYLLQRIETFEGVAILASNLHQNLDEAFLRRFEAVVYFPPPRAEERLRLWREGFSPKARVTADLERLARDHDLSGGAIINVIRRVSLAAIARGSGVDSGPVAIGDGEIEEAIRAERGKQT
jgi:SpoVK/Ycf46/Vps4 family AAA+-type ATPase